MNKKRILLEPYQPNHTLLNSPDFIPLSGHYISGFTVGDGCFSFSQSTGKTFGSFYFSIGQHRNNSLLLKSFLPLLGLNDNSLYTYNNLSKINISSRNTIVNCIFPFFDNYPLYGIKDITLNKPACADNLQQSCLDLNNQEVINAMLNIWNNNELSLSSNGKIDQRSLTRLRRGNILT